MQGKSYVFVANMADRKMGEHMSQGMLTMADTEGGVTLIPVPDSVMPGTAVR